MTLDDFVSAVSDAPEPVLARILLQRLGNRFNRTERDEFHRIPCDTVDATIDYLVKRGLASSSQNSYVLTPEGKKLSESGDWRAVPSDITAETSYEEVIQIVEELPQFAFNYHFLREIPAEEISFEDEGTRALQAMGLEKSMRESLAPVYAELLGIPREHMPNVLPTGRITAIARGMKLEQLRRRPHHISGYLQELRGLGGYCVMEMDIPQEHPMNRAIMDVMNPHRQDGEKPCIVKVLDRVDYEPFMYETAVLLDKAVKSAFDVVSKIPSAKPLR